MAWINYVEKKLYLHNLTTESTTDEKEPSFVYAKWWTSNFKKNSIHSMSLFNTYNLYKWHAYESFMTITYNLLGR